MGSIGVLERGEFKIVTHGIPVRSCIFFEKKKYLPYKEHFVWDGRNDMQEVGLVHSTNENA